MIDKILIFLITATLLFKVCRCYHQKNKNVENYRVIGVNERRQTSFLPPGFLPVSDFYTINSVPVF
jgi:hypothetical protein